MSLTPELGQMLHGNPTGNYGTTEWVNALISALLVEIERVYWNNNQKEWEASEDPGLNGVVFRPYYWGDDPHEAELPNLKFIFSDQEIRWYKHPGRGMSCTLLWTPEEWIEWFNLGLQAIRLNEKE